MRQEHEFALPVQHVSTTAYLVAALRARENLRHDAHFHDDLADVLVGHEVDELLLDSPSTDFGVWLMVVRTCIIDYWIEMKVRSGVDMVVNLAAGLDTRPYRMQTLPRSLQWVEVDFAGIINHKNQLLATETPRCALRRVVADLSVETERQKIINIMDNEAGEVLILTEGLLSYLDQEVVEALAADLFGVQTARWWITDIVTPEFRAWTMSFWQGAVQRLKATQPISLSDADGDEAIHLRFIPEDPVGFFGGQGWVLDNFRSYREESLHLQRNPPAHNGSVQAALALGAHSGYGLLRPARRS